MLPGAAIVTQLFKHGVFIKFLVYVGLPIVLYNLFVEIVQEVMEFMLGFLQGVEIGSVVLGAWGGLASYLFCVMGLDKALSIVLTAASVRFVLSMIPFIGVK